MGLRPSEQRFSPAWGRPDPEGRRDLIIDRLVAVKAPVAHGLDGSREAVAALVEVLLRVRPGASEAMLGQRVSRLERSALQGSK